MIEFYIDTRVDLKTVFPHGPPTLRTLTLQGIHEAFLAQCSAKYAAVSKTRPEFTGANTEMVSYVNVVLVYM